MQKYITGLVVGKFCPLHNGHEYLIKTALKQCKKVIVLSYTSEKFPRCYAHNREQWLRNIDCDQQRLSIFVIDNENDTKRINDNDPDIIHREFCAHYLFYKLNTSVQAVFTSEDYGYGFADYLTHYFEEKFKTPSTVEHILVDLKREIFPVSGTYIRECIQSKNTSEIIKLTPKHVHRSLLNDKVLLLGAESTGKTTISQEVARRLNTQWVPEYGRELYEKRILSHGKMFYEDLEHIAKTQLKNEDRLFNRLDLGQYLICDTSELTTYFFSIEYFNVCSNYFDFVVERTLLRYQYIFLCDIDFPMVQDGTRKDEDFRNRLHNNYKSHLDEKYILLSGNLEEKIETVIAVLSKNKC